MKIKNGVKVSGVKPEIIIALVIADQIWSTLGQELVITSITDSKHGSHSLHAFGYAADLRTRYFSEIEKNDAAVKLTASLNNDYDVVVEKDHIHIEFDPR